MTTTLRQIRRDVLRDLGDLRVLTATATGGTDTFIDTTNLSGEVGAYAGRDVLFTAGTAANLGLQRYVTGSSSTQRAIGFGISLPAITAVNDECEMINTRGTGYRFQDTNDAINRAIRMVADRGPVLTSSDSSVFDRGVGIPIPADYVAVGPVQWQDESDTAVWHTIPRARVANGSGWWVDKPTRTVIIGGRWMTVLDDRTFKLWGLAAPAQLYDDEDTTEVNDDYLVAQAKAILTAANHLRRSTPETERTMFMLQQMANALRARVVTRRSPHSVAL